MATTVGKTHCVPCGKEKIVYKCEGCLQTFCINHLTDHRRELGLQLDDLEHQRNVFRQKRTEETHHPQEQMLVQEINQWETNSINLIRQTADEARQILANHAAENIRKIEDELTRLTEELKIVREENDFNELHLNQFKEKFDKLEEQLNKPSNISIRHDSSLLIDRISIAISSEEIQQTASSTTDRRLDLTHHDNDRTDDGQSREWNIRANEDSKTSSVNFKDNWRYQRQRDDDRWLVEPSRNKDATDESWRSRSTTEKSNRNERNTVALPTSSEQRSEDSVNKASNWRTVDKQRSNPRGSENDRRSQQQHLDESSSSVTVWRPRTRVQEETQDSIRRDSNSNSAGKDGLIRKTRARNRKKNTLINWNTDKNDSDDENWQ